MGRQLRGGVPPHQPRKGGSPRAASSLPVSGHVPNTPMTSLQRRVLWVAILASFVAFLDGAIVNVALPAIQDELGGGLATQQWVVDAYLLTLGALILLAGSLSDTFGRIRLLRAGLALLGTASLACAVAPTGALLIAARAVQGAGAALLVPSSLALITSAFSGPGRAKAIGSWTAWTGTALAGIIVGTALDLDSFRRIMAVVAVLLVAGAAISAVGITNKDAGGYLPDDAAARCQDKIAPGAVAAGSGQRATGNPRTEHYAAKLGPAGHGSGRHGPLHAP